jgi:hypothetical protein
VALTVKSIHFREQSLSQMFEDEEGRFYLVAFCPRVMWYRIGIVMTPEEVAEFRSRPEILDELSYRLGRNFAEFEDRKVPDEVRDIILDS